LTAAGVPSQKDPCGLARSDGKRHDGVTMMPWSCGHPLIWDVTCSDTFAKTYRCLAISHTWAVADFAESRKEDLYCHLQSTLIFVPVAVETTGAFGTKSSRFLKDCTGRLHSHSGNALSGSMAQH
jgi:hypothetical protein